MGITKIIVALLIAFNAIFDAAGQLPRFRFIGAPTRTTPSEWSYLVKDGIICKTETSNSRWDQKETGHFHYDVRSASWSRLHRLDSILETISSNDVQARLLNDSLLILTATIRQDSFVNLLWHVQADSAFFYIVREGAALSDHVERTALVNVRGDVSFIDEHSDDDASFRVITVNRVLATSDTVSFKIVDRPFATTPSFVIAGNGCWVHMDTMVLWTEDFVRFDTTIIENRSRPIRYRCGVDGNTLIGVRIVGGEFEIYEITSPNRLRTKVIPTTLRPSSTGYFDRWTPLDGIAVLVNNTNGTYDDGFYRYGLSGAEFLGRTMDRVAASSVVLNSDGSILMTSNAGFLISVDSARTWDRIELPVQKPERSEISTVPTITLADDGTLVWAGASGSYSYFDQTTQQFASIPGTTYPARLDKPYQWYRRGNSWLGNAGMNAVASQERGLYMPERPLVDNTFEKPSPVSYTWLDTNFVRGSHDDRFLCWPPNDTIQEKRNIPVSEQRKYSSITDPIHLNAQRYCISNRIPENVDLVDLEKQPWSVQTYDRYLRCNSSRTALTYRFGDSLVSWIDGSSCSQGIAHPIDKLFLGELDSYRRWIDPDVVYPVREDRYFGHDSLIIGLIKKDTSSTTPDSVVIMPRDLSTQRVFPLEGIEEPYVYRLLFDKVNRVYYAQTARGVYCSDVATSVDEELSSSAGDPASRSEMSVTWYDILGAEVATPISAGMYLKVTRSTNGTQTIEKIILQ